MDNLPVFWSFRRCPYAMRARLALESSGVSVGLREILLRDKPQAFLNASPSATVPCLQHSSGVLDESLDIMVWALKQADPSALLDMPQDGWDLIARADGPFKTALDQTKYASRFPDQDAHAARARASEFLFELDKRLEQGALYGARFSLADYAIAPFVRQFAYIDRAWFDAQNWPNLIAWLDRFLASEDFQRIMVKFPIWTEGDEAIVFPQ